MYIPGCFRRLLIPKQLSLISSHINHASVNAHVLGYYTHVIGNRHSINNSLEISDFRLFSTSATLKAMPMEKSWPTVILFGDSLTQVRVKSS